MRRVDYRIERIPIDEGEPRLLRLVDRLEELGRQGWHVASADLAPHPGREREPLTVLLERDRDDAPAANEEGGPATVRSAGEADLDRVARVQRRGPA